MQDKYYAVAIDPAVDGKSMVGLGFEVGIGVLIGLGEGFRLTVGV